MRPLTPANDTARWTAASWHAHVASFHPSHAAASYALHREEMGRLSPSARVITALTMVGKRNARADLEPVSFERAMQLIEAACAHREMRQLPLVSPQPPQQIELPLAG